jgi:hypothetical protein
MMQFSHGSCFEALPEKFVNMTRKKKGQISGQRMMCFAHRQKNPFVFDKIKRGKNIP